MKLRDAVRLIRGKKGTVVRLEIIPASQNASTRKEISITRDEIKLARQKAQAKLIEQPLENGESIKLGIIKLPSFYGDIGPRKTSFFGGPERGTSTTDDVALLLEKLKEKGMDGLVLDLRNNGGGLLDEAIRLSGLFIDEGPIVQIKNSKGHRKVFEDETPGSLYDGPLIVLTNKLSASASEIVAGALQNYSRAIVIGDSSTHGKGTVQTVTEVGRFLAPLGTTRPDVGAVKLTIQKFYLPNGHSTQKRGVVPDIQLPSPNEYLEIGEGTLPHALPWDEIDPTEFTIVNKDLDKVIAELSGESQQRVDSSEAFKNLNEDIANLRKRLDEKTVSLNAATRISEILEDQERRKKLEDIVDSMAETSPDILTIEFNENLEITEKLETSVDLVKANATNAANKDKKAGESEEEEESTLRDYARDLHLKETLNILKDYISSGKVSGSAIAKHSMPTPSS
jgi:carboxyl-terminal processing protease